MTESPSQSKSQSESVPRRRGTLDRRFARAKQTWTERELEILSDKYGLVSDKALSKQLQRSPAALHVAAVRFLKQSRSDNFYTARNVARELGMACGKTVIFWKESGWLEGRRSKVHASRNWRWMFTEEQIVDCLRQRPWLCGHPSLMSESYFRSVVREEWDKDPWYDCQQAGVLMKLHPETMRRYIRRGYLKEIRKPGGPWAGKLLFRRSELLRFQAGRETILPSHREICSGIRRNFLLSRGSPLQVCSFWSVLCRLCGQRVLVQAPPRWFGHRVAERFHQVYVNGSCSHGLKCEVERE